MIALLGDIHGDPLALASAAARAGANGASVLVQLGDFGAWPGMLSKLVAAAKGSPIPIYFVDGNHEYFPLLQEWWGQMANDGASVYHVLRDKLHYVRRGSVLTLDGRTIAFLGGAGSIDYRLRRPGVDWFPEEQIQDADVARLEPWAANRGKGVDFMATHCPPQHVVTKYFETPRLRALEARRAYGAPSDWSDPSTGKVESAWHRLGCPPLYCGHMHETIQDGSVRLLNINELAYV